MSSKKSRYWGVLLLMVIPKLLLGQYAGIDDCPDFKNSNAFCCGITVLLKCEGGLLINKQEYLLLKCSQNNTSDLKLFKQIASGVYHTKYIGNSENDRKFRIEFRGNEEYAYSSLDTCLKQGQKDKSLYFTITVKKTEKETHQNARHTEQHVIQPTKEKEKNIDYYRKILSDKNQITPDRVDALERMRVFVLQQTDNNSDVLKAIGTTLCIRLFDESELEEIKITSAEILGYLYPRKDFIKCLIHCLEQKNNRIRHNAIRSLYRYSFYDSVFKDHYYLLSQVQKDILYESIDQSIREKNVPNYEMYCDITKRLELLDNRYDEIFINNICIECNKNIKSDSLITKVKKIHNNVNLIISILHCVNDSVNEKYNLFENITNELSKLEKSRVLITSFTDKYFDTYNYKLSEAINFLSEDENVNESIINLAKQEIDKDLVNKLWLFNLLLKNKSTTLNYIESKINSMLYVGDTLTQSKSYDFLIKLEEDASFMIKQLPYWLNYTCQHEFNSPRFKNAYPNHVYKMQQIILNCKNETRKNIPAIFNEIEKKPSCDSSFFCWLSSRFPNEPIADEFFANSVKSSQIFDIGTLQILSNKTHISQEIINNVISTYLKERKIASGEKRRLCLKIIIDNSNKNYNKIFFLLNSISDKEGYSVAINDLSNLDIPGINVIDSYVFYLDGIKIKEIKERHKTEHWKRKDAKYFIYERMQIAEIELSKKNTIPKTKRKPDKYMSKHNKSI